MKLFVIIPVHNRKNYTRNCLYALHLQSFCNIQVIVVDDGSTDGTREMILEEFPSVKILQGNGNLWWTGAINFGISFILNHCDKDDYALILNDDIVFDDDYISSLLETTIDYPNALIGSLVVDIADKETILSGGIYIDWKKAKWINLNQGRNIKSFPRNNYIEVSTLTGRGVLIPINVFREIGIYDSQHFLQCGDTEFPIRASQYGYKLIMSYNSVLYSYPGDANHINHKTTYKLKDLKEYYFGVKSNGNIKYRFWFAYSALNNNLWQVSRYFFIDFVRITVHFLRRFRLF